MTSRRGKPSDTFRGNMRYRLLVVTATLLVMLGVAAPSYAKPCGSVTVDLGGVGGEAGAYRIESFGLSCRWTRRVVRRYLIAGHPPRHWYERRRGGRVKLYSTRYQSSIRFRLAS